jgi:hypothetical protein
LVCVQRLDEPESQSFLAIYPHFQKLSAIEIPQEKGSSSVTNGKNIFFNDLKINLKQIEATIIPTWKEIETALESVKVVLIGLVTFEKPSARRKFRENQAQAVKIMQRISLTQQQ